jgi:hypothetical protein
MDKTITILTALQILLDGFCFSIGPWVLLGAIIAWIAPGPSKAQSGDIVVNISQDNGPKN